MSAPRAMRMTPKLAPPSLTGWPKSTRKRAAARSPIAKSCRQEDDEAGRGGKGRRVWGGVVGLRGTWKIYATHTFLRHKVVKSYNIVTMKRYRTLWQEPANIFREQAVKQP